MDEILWTEQINEQVIQLINEFNSYLEISQKLNLPIFLLKKKMRKFKLKIKKKIRQELTPDQKQDIIKYINDGMSYTQISAHLNIKRYIVTYFCFKNTLLEKMDDHIPNWSEYDTKILTQLKISNPALTVREISNIMKKRTNSISVKLQDIGLCGDIHQKIKINRKLKNNNKKKCWNCDTIKNREIDFYEGRTSNVCVVCAKKYSSLNRPDLSLTFKAILNQRLQHCKIRAKKLLLDFDIDYPFLLELFEKQKGKCFYSGRTLITTTGSIDTISVDRIDSSEGYIKTNVVLCTYKINNMKNDLSIEDFYSILTDIYQYQNL